MPCVGCVVGRVIMTMCGLGEGQTRVQTLWKKVDEVMSM